MIAESDGEVSALSNRNRAVAEISQVGGIQLQQAANSSGLDEDVREVGGAWADVAGSLGGGGGVERVLVGEGRLGGGQGGASLVRGAGAVGGGRLGRVFLP